MKEHEKRGTPRVPYIAEVVCENDGNRLTARTSDISTSGVFIHSKLWCEAGSILTLSFPVASTQIETAGEVCYSIPHIGMGVRFLNLKPEYHEIIERLIKSEQDQEQSEKVKTKRRRTIFSGVEPVDKLLGGLERGHLYLAHGDASGKSLFGIEFLIEGLKRGQPGALITTQRKDDAVRRFSRLGYDCLKDIRGGTLVLLTYASDIVEQIRHSLHLEPLLRELGPILDESSPERIVFDPVDNLLDCAKQDDVTTRANQLAVWVRSFGATVVLVANGENRGIIESLTTTVRDSFRFEVRESFDRVVRFMAFEKSPSIPDQAVRVDPSRGIALLEDQQSGELVPEVPGVGHDEPDGIGANNANETAPVGDLQTLADRTEDQSFSERLQDRLKDATSLTSSMTDQGSSGSNTNAAGFSPASSEDVNPKPQTTASGDLDIAGAQEVTSDAFFAMLDELHTFVSSIEPDTDESASAETPHKSVNRRLPESEKFGLQSRQID